MILTNEDLIGECSFGIVFSIKKESSHIIKVFKRFHHHEADIKKRSIIVIEKTCDYEIEAYQTATKYDKLNEIIPVFYGRV